MSAMLAVVLVCCAVTGLQAADFQSIQDAQPLSVDLSSQSDTALANIAGTGIDEATLGGYRPLYPPYFPREPPTQSSGVQPKSSVYYDQEYYTRGVHPGFTDDRLDRHLKIAAGANPFLSSTRSAFPSVKSIGPESRPDGTNAVQPTLLGVQPALIDDQEQRQIKFAAGTNLFLPSTRPTFPEAARPVFQPTLVDVQPVLTDDRDDRQIKITDNHFSRSASSSFSSSYSFRSVKFPSS